MSATPQGLRSTPITRILIYCIICSSITSSLLGVKQSLHLQLSPHIVVYGQIYRILTWQLAYNNASEVMSAAYVLYILRVLERTLGSRKYLSLVLLSFFITSIVTPLLLALISFPLPLGTMNQLPSGMNASLFTLLSVYFSIIPSRYTLLISGDSNIERAVIFTDKVFTYLVAAPLALNTSLPSLLCASTGWLVGYAWKSELLPGAHWRVPRKWFTLDQGSLHEEDGARPPRALSQEVFDTIRGRF